MRHLALYAVFSAVSGFAFGQARLPRQPVIDVHMHSQSLSDLEHYGPNPVTGEKRLESVEAHIKQILSMMKRYNVVLGIAGGDLENVEQLRKAATEEAAAGTPRQRHNRRFACNGEGVRHYFENL